MEPPLDPERDLCAYCRDEHEPADSSCPLCGAPHHARCWRRNGGCALAGCDARPGAFVPPSVTGPLEPVPHAAPTARFPQVPPASPHDPADDARPRRHRRVAALAFGAVIVLAVVAIATIWTRGGEDAETTAAEAEPTDSEEEEGERKGAEVPDVQGLEYEEARAVLREALLHTRPVEEERDDSPPDTVVAQDPPAGTRVETWTFVEVTVATPPPQRPVADGPLVLGLLLPQTGELAWIHEGMLAGAELAVHEINAAGGVLGHPVELVHGDEGDRPGVARRSVEDLLDRGVAGIVGAASSAGTLAVIDQVAAAGVVQCSPSNTSPALTGYPHGGWYVRLQASDALQGHALAELAIEAGHQRVVVVGRDDDYGKGIADAAASSLRTAETQHEVIVYRDRDSLEAVAEEVAGHHPDGIIVASSDEGVQLLRHLIDRGLGPRDVGVYAADGLAFPTLPTEVAPQDTAVLDGLTGTILALDPPPRFLDRLTEFRQIEVAAFAVETYECVHMLALAAVAAGSIDPAELRGRLLELSGGDSCLTYGQCRDLLESGRAIRYQGFTRRQIDERGEPFVGEYEIWQLVDARFHTIDFRYVGAE